MDRIVLMVINIQDEQKQKEQRKIFTHCLVDSKVLGDSGLRDDDQGVALEEDGPSEAVASGNRIDM